jgi:serine/threonine protein kinase
MIDKKLNNYEIVEKIGKGGMGEVYRAHDTKLNRDVALKVLPAEFANDPERMARFKREAQLLASLNHTNIAAIHGLEESGGVTALVMELAEGSTLADRISKGPIPLDEALAIARQIAEALEAAHEKGIIHRDLKPANIKVTPEGAVKVLDFGLAKALEGEAAVADASQSPTLSLAATKAGVILGTAAYMSPEQARGKSVDKRADIWAFGCVLFETLTGRQLFSGDTVSDTLAAVLTREPEWTTIPPGVNPLLRRCLEKDPKNRCRDIGDVKLEIVQILANPHKAYDQPEMFAEQKSKLHKTLPWIAAALIFGILAGGMIVWKLKPLEPHPVTRLYFELPKDQKYPDNGLTPLLAVSPDGKKIAYCTPGGIYLHSIDKWDAELVRGTEGNPERPFFSPDGKWIGYWSSHESQLKKIPVDGGMPVPLTNVTSISYLSWNPDDTIIFAGTKGIMRISANGGEVETLIEVKSETFFSPRFLPGGKAVIFTIMTDEGYKIAGQLLQDKKYKILADGSDAHYFQSGHLVYVDLNNDLCAIPFDPEKLEINSGTPIPLVKNIFRFGGAPQFNVSASGTIVYLQDASTLGSKRALVWVDRNGNEERLLDQQDAISPIISPDGKKIAFSVGRGPGHIYIWDLARKKRDRLFTDTNAAAQDLFPLWTSPNGSRIAFYHQSGSNMGIDSIEDSGTQNISHLCSKPGYLIHTGCWSGDANTLLAVLSPLDGQNYDIGMCSPGWKPLLQEKYSELQPQISPDGRCMAYTSNETGQHEIYVRPFPEVDKGRWKVSTDGGDSPLWNPNGRELFYRSGDAVMAVSVQPDADFRFETGTPKSLFRGTYVSADARIATLEPHPWDIHPKDTRFLMMKETEPVANGTSRNIYVVVNWLEELKKLVPAK